MNPWIVVVQHNEMLLAQKNITFPDYPFFQCGFGNPQLLSRRTYDGRRLQEDNPILLPDIVGMDRDVVTWHFPSKNLQCRRSLIPILYVATIRGPSSGCIRSSNQQ